MSAPARFVGGVEVLPTRNEARDRAWGIWLNQHPAVKDIPELLELLGPMWQDCWRMASLDAIRRNDQAGIVGLELARLLQEHIELICEDAELARVEREAEVESAYYRREDLEDLPF